MTKPAYIVGGIVILCALIYLVTGGSVLVLFPFLALGVIIWAIIKYALTVPEELDSRQLYNVMYGSFWGMIILVIFGLILYNQGHSNAALLCAADAGLCTVIIACLRPSFLKREADEKGSQQYDQYGTAGWSSWAELFAAGFSWQGLWLVDGFSIEEPCHVMVTGGSRAGKGASILIPNLLIQPTGSNFIFDPKGELAAITARCQNLFGQRVFIFDPWNEQERLGATHGIRRTGFNPFAYLKRVPEAMIDSAGMIAEYLIPDIPGTRDPYWNSRARSLIKLLILHILTGMPVKDHHFWTVYKFLRLNQGDWRNLLFEMKENKALDGYISMGADELAGMGDAQKTFATIRSTAQDATIMFESPQLREFLLTDDFDPFELTNGDCTVYVILPESYHDTHYPWLRLMVGLCMRACNARPNQRVNFFLDEFPLMRRMNDVIRNFGFGLGQKVVLFTFAQSLSHLKDIYGEDGLNSMAANARVKLFLGIDDPYTQKYVSELLGTATRTKVHTTQGPNGASWSEEQYGRPLMTPEEVGKCKDIIFTSQGLKYLFPKVGYYQNRYDRLPANSPFLTKEQKKLRKKGLPLEDWREIFQDRVDPRPRHAH